MYVDPDTEAEWDRWERRNPGVMHPARRRHQVSEQMRLREQDAAPYRDEILPHETSIAARGRASRGNQRRF